MPLDQGKCDSAFHSGTFANVISVFVGSDVPGKIITETNIDGISREIPRRTVGRLISKRLEPMNLRVRDEPSSIRAREVRTSRESLQECKGATNAGRVCASALRSSVPA